MCVVVFFFIVMVIEPSSTLASVPSRALSICMEWRKMVKNAGDDEHGGTAATDVRMC